MLRRKFVNIIVPLLLLLLIVLFVLFSDETLTIDFAYTLTPTIELIQIPKTLVPTIGILIQTKVPKIGIVEVDFLNIRKCPGIKCPIIEVISKGEYFFVSKIKFVELDNSIWFCNSNENCVNSKFIKLEK